MRKHAPAPTYHEGKEPNASGGQAFARPPDTRPHQRAVELKNEVMRSANSRQPIAISLLTLRFAFCGTGRNRA